MYYQRPMKPFRTPHRPKTRNCRHFCPKTYPERDFYPSNFRVFFTLFDAFLLYLCQCTRSHKMRAFSRCPPTFAFARHQSATQSAPKPDPKLRAFSGVKLFRSRCPPIFAPVRQQSATQTASKAGPNLRAFSRVLRTSHSLGAKAHRRPGPSLRAFSRVSQVYLPRAACVSLPWRQVDIKLLR